MVTTQQMFRNVPLAKITKPETGLLLSRKKKKQAAEVRWKQYPFGIAGKIK